MIFSLVCLFIIVLVYLVALPKLTIASFRQNLFEIRAALFELAENDPDFKFSHPIYQKFEFQLNSTIQIAHICTLWHILIYSAISKLFGKQSKGTGSTLLSTFEKESVTIKSEKTKKDLEKLIDRYHLEIVFTVLLSAPITTCLVLITIVLPILIWNSKQKLQNRLFSIVQAQSFTYKRAHSF